MSQTLSFPTKVILLKPWPSQGCLVPPFTKLGTNGYTWSEACQELFLHTV